MTSKLSNTNFFSQIVDLLQSARNNVVRTINQTMVTTYFEIGRKIVEEEQDGKERADYGKQIIKQLSNVLTLEFGKGFSERNIEQMRQFYLVYSKPQTLSADFKNISQTSSAKSTNAISETPSRNFDLSWSHYLKLMRIDDENERKFYEIETEKNNWSVRELQRQFDSALYTRFVFKQKQRQGNRTHGNGFTFVARQKRIKTINKRTGKTALKPYKFANRPSQY